MRGLLLALGALVASGLLFVLLLNVVADTSPTDCAKVRDPAPGVWQAGDFDTRSRIVGDLSLCERLQGRTREAVKALLGPPTEE